MAGTKEPGRRTRQTGTRVKNETKQKAGTAAAKSSGKRSRGTIEVRESETIETPGPLSGDPDTEDVIWIDNESGNVAYRLTRHTENALPMSKLWDGALKYSQDLRTRAGPHLATADLSADELSRIDPRNNAHILSSLVTTKGELRTKDNQSAATAAARNADGSFATDGQEKEYKAIDYKKRAAALTIERDALQKQIDAYLELAEKTAPGQKLPDFDTFDKDNGLQWLAEAIPSTTTKRKLAQYHQAMQGHVRSLAEVFRHDLSILGTVCRRYEKTLSAKIRTLIALEQQVVRTAAANEQYEVPLWAHAALPLEAHICQCEICTAPKPVTPATKSSLYKIPQLQPPATKPLTDLERQAANEFVTNIAEQPDLIYWMLYHSAKTPTAILTDNDIDTVMAHLQGAGLVERHDMNSQRVSVAGILDLAQKKQLPLHQYMATYDFDSADGIEPVCFVKKTAKAKETAEHTPHKVVKKTKVQKKAVDTVGNPADTHESPAEMRYKPDDAQLDHRDTQADVSGTQPSTYTQTMPFNNWTPVNTTTVNQMTTIDPRLLLPRGHDQLTMNTETDQQTSSTELPFDSDALTHSANTATTEEAEGGLQFDDLDEEDIDILIEIMKEGEVLEFGEQPIPKRIIQKIYETHRHRFEMLPEALRS